MRYKIDLSFFCCYLNSKRSILDIHYGSYELEFETTQLLCWISSPFKWIRGRLFEVMGDIVACSRGVFKLFVWMLSEESAEAEATIFCDKDFEDMNSVGDPFVEMLLSRLLLLPFWWFSSLMGFMNWLGGDNWGFGDLDWGWSRWWYGEGLHWWGDSGAELSETCLFIWE